MFYYLYQIKNTVNSKIYVGVHQTEVLDDGYMGSGAVIKAAIKKYGKGAFTKTILQFFDSAEAMYAREKEIVNSDFLLREDVYNLRCGGFGGFDHINSRPIEERVNLLAFRKKVERGELTPGGTKFWSEASYNKVVEQAAKNNASGLTSGWKHTEEFKRAQSERSIGEKNSQYGKYWYNNGLKNFKAAPEQAAILGLTKGRICC